MINFNEKDYFLPTIKSDSKLGRLVTKNPYRVYGLKQADNPLIYIEYDGRTRNIEKHINSLRDFFAENEVFAEFEDTLDNKISIGIRKDLRGETILCSSILQTIIYHLEGRLSLPYGSVLPCKDALGKLQKRKVKEDKMKVNLPPIAPTKEFSY